MAGEQTQTFDPDSFHQNYVQQNGGGFDPDAFHEQYTATPPPAVRPAKEMTPGSRSVSEGFDVLADRMRFARESQQRENEVNAAKTGQQPSFWNRAKMFGEGVGESTARLASGATSPTGVAIAAAQAVPVAGELVDAGLLLHGTGKAISHARGALQANPDEVEQALGGAAEAFGGAAGVGSKLGVARARAQMALPEGETPTVRQTLANTETARAGRAVGEAISPITERLRVPEAPKALTQAIQPGVNIPRAQESIGVAGPRLQQLRQAGAITGEDGEPLTEFKSPADLLQGVKSAKGHIWDAIEDRMRGVNDLQTDTSSVADAMEQSISGRTSKQFSGEASAIRNRAATYRGSMSLREIEEAIQDANDDLRNYYKRSSPTDSPTGPGMRATEAEVRSLRSLLDDKVQDLRGSGVADLKREYGALRDVEKATARANAVATRQKGATLWEGLAALRAAGDFASGNVLGAAKGAGTLAVGRWLAKLRDPNFLIDQAFQGKKGFTPANAIERPPIDVAQGEFVPPRNAAAPQARQAAPPAIVGARTALPSAERPRLTGRTAQQEPVVTPAPAGTPQLGTKLGNRAEFPRRLLTAPGAVNALQSSGEPITPGARRALPSAKAEDLTPARTPESGIRTVGGRVMEPEWRGGEQTGDLTPARESTKAPAKIEEAQSGKELADQRQRLAQLDKKWSDLNDRLRRARSYSVTKQITTKLRAITDERNALHSKFGMREEAESVGEAKNPLETYQSYPKEEQSWMDEWAKQIPHLPQVLREEQMRELGKFGGAYTPLKEKIARQYKAQQAGKPRQLDRTVGDIISEDDSAPF